MIDHDNIATKARRGGLLKLIEGDTYLDLYDEVQRLRTEARQWRGQTYTVDETAERIAAFEASARQWRETYCLASPGSDEEFHAVLTGFDTAVGLFRSVVKGDSDE